MIALNSNPGCLGGCKALVPRELETERICVQHFILSIESACTVMRREAAMEGANAARKREIESYVKSTALKLSDVATGSARLSDDLKKRVLTTMLTLMNLQESLDRSAARFPQIRPPQRAVEQTPHPALMLG
ncbi:MAG: hypothetical protein ABSA57_09010 [Candidatus Acidiferrales bacterium]|jgi:hypothetical protein